MTVPPDGIRRARRERLLRPETVLHTVALGANRFAFPAPGQARADEVCMVFRRPDGRILTLRKTFYPAGIARLPTGALRPGEAILHALRREAAEETGLPAAPAQLAAVVDYRIAAEAEAPSCATYAFLIEGVRGEPAARDPDEQVEAFRWIEPADLLTLAAALEDLPAEPAGDLESSWREWGVFRAVIHRVLWNVLRPASRI